MRAPGSETRWSARAIVGLRLPGVGIYPHSANPIDTSSVRMGRDQTGVVA
jgi:hypothetical protein